MAIQIINLDIIIQQIINFEIVSLSIWRKHGGPWLGPATIIIIIIIIIIQIINLDILEFISFSISSPCKSVENSKVTENERPWWKMSTIGVVSGHFSFHSPFLCAL